MITGEDLIVLAGRGLLRALAWVPRSVLRGVARVGAVFWYAFDGRHRHISIANIKTALGYSDAEARRLARANFRHLAEVALELASARRVTADNWQELAEIEGAEHIQASLEKGKGVFALTSHQGNWEVMAYLSPFMFPASRLNILMRPLKPLWVARIANGLRETYGNIMLDRTNATLEILRALKRNEIIGVLLDQNPKGHMGVETPFFGGTVPTNKSLALLALRSGAAVHPAFNRRVAPGKYLITVHPALPLPAEGDMEDRVRSATCMFTAAIEAEIRRHPEQWFWTYRRFLFFRKEGGAPRAEAVPGA